jgi:hypothetical protein
MTAVPKNSSVPMMTEERLHAHWFSGPQAPFWNYDPRKITTGIEIEYFIARGDESNFILATRDDYLKVMQHLVNRSGYKDHKLHDQPGRISKDTQSGFIAVKPDFAWHILEVSLPPRSNVTEQAVMIENVLAEIDDALSQHELKRLTISCLPGPQKVDLVGQERLSDFTRAVHQQSGDGGARNPFCDPYFPAYTAATHVHLNAFNDAALNMWPALFAIEAGVGEIYCRGRSFDGISVESVRSEFLKHSMGPGYKLKGIPEKVPVSPAEYAAAMNGSNHAFPHDRFFPVRDVSYIRPSKYGTIEFRSACTTPTVDEIIEIACWRMTQLVAANTFLTSTLRIQESVSAAIQILDKLGIVPDKTARVIDAKIAASEWGKK